MIALGSYQTFALAAVTAGLALRHPSRLLYESFEKDLLVKSRVLPVLGILKLHLSPDGKTGVEFQTLFEGRCDTRSTILK